MFDFDRNVCVTVRGVRAWSSRVSLFRVSVMSLKVQEYHSYRLFIPHENHSKINARVHTQFNEILNSRFALEHRYTEKERERGGRREERNIHYVPPVFESYMLQYCGVVDKVYFACAVSAPSFLVNTGRSVLPRLYFGSWPVLGPL